MKKGQSLMTWVFIVLTVTLFFAVSCFLLLQKAVNERAVMDKRYQANEIASIINILQASPLETEQAYESHFCAEIDHAVKIKDYSVDVIISSVEIEEGTIGCGEGGKYIVREEKIRVGS